MPSTMQRIKALISLSATSAALLAGACDAPVESFDREAEDLALEIDAEEEEQEAADAERSAADELAFEDGEERFGEGVTLLDRIEMAGGTELSFLHLDIEGEESVAVIERVPPGALPLSAVGMEDASALDLYLAVTEPEDEIPVALLHLADDNQLGERGWLDQQIDRGDFDLTSEPDVQTSACNAGFEGYFEGWTFGWDVKELHLNEDPTTDPDWEGPRDPDLGITCSGCSNWYFRDRVPNDAYELYNIDEVKLGYFACDIAWRPTIETNYGNDLPHYGPIVKFRYRTEGNAATGQVYSKDLLEADEGTDYFYHWTGNSSFNDYDWNIAILGGRSADRFDFGFAGQHHGW